MHNLTHHRKWPYSRLMSVDARLFLWFGLCKSKHSVLNTLNLIRYYEKPYNDQQFPVIEPISRRKSEMLRIGTLFY